MFQLMCTLKKKKAPTPTYYVFEFNYLLYKCTTCTRTTGLRYTRLLLYLLTSNDSDNDENNETEDSDRN